jgi:hypothetical protein
VTERFSLSNFRETLTLLLHEKEKKKHSETMKVTARAQEQIETIHGCELPMRFLLVNG